MSTIDFVFFAEYEPVKHGRKQNYQWPGNHREKTADEFDDQQANRNQPGAATPTSFQPPHPLITSNIGRLG